MAFAEAFNQSMATVLRMKQDQYKQRQEAIDRAQKVYDDYRTYEKALDVSDPILRRTLLEEWHIAHGGDPKDPKVKRLIDLGVKGDEATKLQMKNMAKRVLVDLTREDPEQGRALIDGYASGKVPFKDLADMNEKAKARRLRKDLDAGRPSQQPAPGMPLETGRIAAPPQTPPMQAPGAISGQDPQRQLGTPESPQPKGMSDFDPFSVDNLATKKMKNVFPDMAPKPAGDTGVVQKINFVESGGDATAKNPNSSARGLGQFIDSTWLNTINQYEPELTEGLTRQQVLDLRNDPDISRRMTAHYAAENQTYLAQAGLDTNAGNTYLAHFAGPQGAVKLLQADPEASAASVLGSKAVSANPFLKGKTAGWVVNWAQRKMGGAGAEAPATAGGFDEPALVKTETIPANQAPQPAGQVEQPAQSAPQAQPDQKSPADKMLEDAAYYGNKYPDVANSLRATAEKLKKEEQRDQRVGAAGPAAAEALRLPEKFGGTAFERNIGPELADSDPSMVSGSILGTGGSFDAGGLNRMMHRAGRNIVGMFRGGATTEEVQDSIKAQQDRFLTALRPAIRIEGEGSQSDAELRQLESSVGKWASARTVEEYNRRVNESMDFAEQLTGMKFARPEPMRKDTDPKTAEQDVTGVEKAGAALAKVPDQIAETLSDKNVVSILEQILKAVTAPAFPGPFNR